MIMAKTHKGLRSVEVLKHRRQRKHSEVQLQQKKTELALKTELLHRLEVQFVSNDAIEIEVAENVLPEFMLVLDDVAVTSLYDYEQVSASLFIFRPKQLL